MSDPLSPHGPRKGKVVNIRIKFLDDTVHVFQVAVSPILLQLRTRAQPPLLNICSPFSKNINFFLYFIFQPQPASFPFEKSTGTSLVLVITFKLIGIESYM